MSIKKNIGMITNSNLNLLLNPEKLGRLTENNNNKFSINVSTNKKYKKNIVENI